MARAAGDVVIETEETPLIADERPQRSHRGVLVAAAALVCTVGLYAKWAGTGGAESAPVDRRGEATGASIRANSNIEDNIPAWCFLITCLIPICKWIYSAVQSKDLKSEMAKTSVDTVFMLALYLAAWGVRSGNGRHNLVWVGCVLCFVSVIMMALKECGVTTNDAIAKILQNVGVCTIVVVWALNLDIDTDYIPAWCFVLTCLIPVVKWIIDAVTNKGLSGTMDSVNASTVFMLTIYLISSGAATRKSFIWVGCILCLVSVILTALKECKVPVGDERIGKVLQNIGVCVIIVFCALKLKVDTDFAAIWCFLLTCLIPVCKYIINSVKSKGVDGDVEVSEDTVFMLCVYLLAFHAGIGHQHNFIWVGCVLCLVSVILSALKECGVDFANSDTIGKVLQNVGVAIVVVFGAIYIL